MHDLQARDEGEPALQHLGVLRRSGEIATAVRADDHGHLNLAAVHVAHEGRLVDQLVRGDGHPVVELDFAHGAQSRRGSAHGQARVTVFRNGRIKDARIAKLLVQALGRTVGSAALSLFKTDQNNLIIAAHFFAKGHRNRLRKRAFFHNRILHIH